MTNFDLIKAWLSEDSYGDGVEIEIDGKPGIMFGDDECWDVNRFYQYFLSNDGKLYKAYYETDNETPLDCIDYNAPYDVVEQDTDFILD